MAKLIVDRIIDRVAQSNGAISVGLLAADLRLATDTVKRHVECLIEAGRLEFGYDGQALELTASERREREIDARVRSHK